MTEATNPATTDREIDAWKTSGSSPPPQPSSDPTLQDAPEHRPRSIAAPTPEQWMTLAEIAEVLRVSPRTVMRWADGGDIPVLILPAGRKRVSREQFETWLTNHSTHQEVA